MPTPIARWNPQRTLWETETLSLFSEQSEPFSETWPTSGYMSADGSLFPLPPSAPPTAENESSSLRLLPSPVAQQSGNPPGVHLRKKPGRKRVTDLAIIVENRLMETGGELLPTPVATDAHGTRNSTANRTPGSTASIGDTLTDAMWKLEQENQRGSSEDLMPAVSGARPVELLPTPRSAAGRTGRSAAVRRDSMSAPSLEQAIEIANGALPREFQSWEELPASWQLLPTPSAADGGGGHTTRSGDCIGELLLPAIARAHANGDLLPTPNASDGTGGGQHPDKREGHSRQPIDYVLAGATAWGKYEQAIRRWERVVGPAPAPTEPNRNGKPRLNPAFSEWMMGWPSGWVTDPAIGISRNDQLKIIGNGVCPQQAVAALRWLLSVSEVAA